MTSVAIKIPAGAIFTVTSGEYSDYHVQGIFRANTEIDQEALLKRWLDQHPDQRAKYKFDGAGFLAWIFGLGLIDQIESWEFYLGDYGRAETLCVNHCVNHYQLDQTAAAPTK